MTTKPTTRTVRPVAPEELAPGMFVCVMSATSQAWPDTDCVPGGSTLRVLRLVFIPEGAGVPLRVQSVCLPFVLVSGFDGRAQTLDIRLVRLARVRKKHAKAAFEALARNRKLDRKAGGPSA